MPNVVAFRLYHRGTSAAANPKTSGLARLPSRSSASEKILNWSAGIYPRAFQLEIAGSPTRANAAAAELPPTASTISSTELSTHCEYSHSVKMSRGHISAVENGTGIQPIHGMDMAIKGIARRLEATQDALELSSAQLCREIDVAPNRWSQYVNGTRLITLPVALKLCTAYGVTLDWIYRGDRSGLPQRLHQKIRLVA